MVLWAGVLKVLLFMPFDLVFAEQRPFEVDRGFLARFHVDATSSPLTPQKILGLAEVSPLMSLSKENRYDMNCMGYRHTTSMYGTRLIVLSTSTLHLSHPSCRRYHTTSYL